MVPDQILNPPKPPWKLPATYCYFGHPGLPCNIYYGLYLHIPLEVPKSQTPLSNCFLRFYKNFVCVHVLLQ